MDGYETKDGYAIKDDRLSYFVAKQELKKIYGLGMKAVQRGDHKYINFLLLNLDQLEDALTTKFKIDSFGLHILKKEISGMRHSFLTGLKKKQAEDAANEKKRRKSTQSRNQ